MATLARVTVFLLILAPAGCVFFHSAGPADMLRARILPVPEGAPAIPEIPATAPPGAGPLLPPPDAAAAVCPADNPAAAFEGLLTLEQAIELALHANPTLEVLHERIAQAEGGQLVSFSEFLPQSLVTYRHIEGTPTEEPFSLPTLPTNLVGNVSFGGMSDRFDLTELHLQWTLCDFGRRAGKFGQARTAVDIARLQYGRAQQTVAFNVAVAYFAVLRAQATERVAEEAVRQAEVSLRDARNFLRRGTGIRNEVLRADVLLAEMRLGLVKAHTAAGVAVAGLNQVLGINVSAPTRVADRPDLPPFTKTLDDCLRLAADNRLEFGIVMDTIRSARLGGEVARADFFPRVLVGGVAAHETFPGKESNLTAGGLAIQLDLFEGGKRVGRLHAAKAELGAAVAEGKEVCDRISYEVHVAYLEVVDARQRIDLSATAVRQATENLRVVRDLFDKGDATPTDVVDGELALTRAQQSYATALYDYQTALARLAYAVGLPGLSSPGDHPHE